MKHIENTKENQLLKLNSAHHTLLGEIEKIHAWKASVELECQQKVSKNCLVIFCKVIAKYIAFVH